MKIIGNMDYNYDLDCYLSLNQMIRDFDLKDYVILETNICLNNLLYIMRESKVYFHPVVGEHFGISIVEAMAAGLVPVVSDVGRPTEFVPKNTISTHLKVLSKLYPLLLIQYMLKEFR